MVTKYTTGQAVLIPATISTAEQIDGKIVYHVEADTWNGIPEDAIIVDEKNRCSDGDEDILGQLAQR